AHLGEELAIDVRGLSLLTLQKPKARLVEIGLTPPAEPKSEPVGTIEAHSQERRRRDDCIKLTDGISGERSKVTMQPAPRHEPIGQRALQGQGYAPQDLLADALVDGGTLWVERRDRMGGTRNGVR